MGCDIHIVLERKSKLLDKWVGIDSFRWMPPDVDGKYISHVARSRNYQRFAELAGVRSGDEGNYPEPRGLPDDASDLARDEAEKWGVDGHSHSWLPLDEAVTIFLATDANPSDMLLEEHPRTHDPYYWYFYIHREDAQRDEHRIVFWFDN